MRGTRRARFAIAGVALIAAACSDDGTAPASLATSTSTSTSTSTTTTISAEPPALEMILVDVSASPTSFNTLSAEVSVTTDLDSTVTVRAESDDGHVVEATGGAPGTDHEVTVIGLRADRTYDITATATADGAEGADTTVFTSGSIPDHFPSVRVVTSDPAGMAPGVTMFPVSARGEGFPDATTRPGETIAGTNLLMAVDGAGEIVWYLELPGRVSDFEVTDDGTILYVEDQLRVVEITTTGEILRRWEGRSSAALREGEPAPEGTILVDTDTMHHEIAVLANGNLLTLSTELLDSGLDAVLCETEQDLSDGFAIISDIVVEFDPLTGEVVREWPLRELVDPVAQPGAVICNTVPFPTWYPGEPTAGDWTHANSVAIDNDRGRLLVSIRHLNSVLALDLGQDSADTPVWQLGPDLDFDLAGTDAEWQYMQHAPEVNDDGTLIVFDNGNLRPGTTLVDGDEAPYSRAVIYDVDEETMVAIQIWEHVAFEDDGSPIYADFVGDADLLANGNVLITHGGIIHSGFTFDEESDTDVLFARVKGRLFEVAPDGPSGGSTVFEIEVVDSRVGWFVFAAERLEALPISASPLTQG